MVIIAWVWEEKACVRNEALIWVQARAHIVALSVFIDSIRCLYTVLAGSL